MLFALVALQLVLIVEFPFTVHGRTYYNARCNDTLFDDTLHECCGGELILRLSSRKCCGATIYRKRLAVCCKGDFLLSKLAGTTCEEFLAS
ncbi:hypothetical protein NP493_1437g00015 [Ridgeia piscesae]|uniref:Galaxin-like repeats domain-containing protein n=1 Tax=Ridgeia piscesae TaxID=27915 RepID=A0AAD9K4K9_RIDPI|nr:hypothetical protein NP493_1437g00015 [Ridgeia piscesae]